MVLKLRTCFQEQQRSKPCKAPEARIGKCRFVLGENRLPMAVIAQRFSFTLYGLVVLSQSGKVGQVGKRNGFTC
jgi:hypothetical protein